MVDEETCATSVPGVFAGGDAVSGAATVILAMGARQARRGGHRVVSDAGQLAAIPKNDVGTAMVACPAAPISARQLGRSLPGPPLRSPSRPKP